MNFFRTTDTTDTTIWTPGFIFSVKLSLILFLEASSVEQVLQITCFSLWRHMGLATNMNQPSCQ